MALRVERFALQAVARDILPENPHGAVPAGQNQGV